MWSKIVSDTFKLQTNGYPQNHSDILTVFDKAVLLYKLLSDRNHLINKLQAGDTFRLERSILASKLTFLYLAFTDSIFLETNVLEASMTPWTFWITGTRN